MKLFEELMCTFQLFPVYKLSLEEKTDEFWYSDIQNAQEIS